VRNDPALMNFVLGMIVVVFCREWEKGNLINPRQSQGDLPEEDRRPQARRPSRNRRRRRRKEVSRMFMFGAERYA